MKPDEDNRKENTIKQLIQSVEFMRNSFEQMVEAINIQAKLYRTSFDALVKEGFSELQAMEILKVRGAHI